ncbi:MAG: hypothetical protein EOO77_12100 [Oxalobacteraceae bacterium]|nr:MAG: hypothetical protein EOO77_12100 [Oxalobacteraceae bacterium]
MKAGGQEIERYERGHSEDIDPEFITLGELTLEVGPKGLRRLAEFLQDCAESMERGSQQDHFHYNNNINDRPQIVVINKKIAKQRRRELAASKDV